MDVSARYTEPVHPGTPGAARMGVIKIGDVEWYTIIPPESGEIRTAYDAFLKAGGVTAEYSTPPVDLPAYLAQRRWELETGGITVGGAPVATDDRGKLMILGARTKAKETGEPKRWKVGPGQFVDLPAAAIIAAADAVEAHVQACFDAEDAILAMIEAGTITTPEGIDAELAKIPTAY